MSTTYRTQNWPIGPAEQRGGAQRRLALQQRQELLAKTDLFKGLPKRHLRSIARVTSVSRHPAGSSIVEEGKPGSTFYAVAEGKAKIVRRGRTLHRIGPGDFFGEIALLDPGPRSASVIAETDVRCLLLESKDFFEVVTAEPVLAERMLKGLARWLRQADPGELS
jgi:CRP-like cAMP-binding protein